MSALISNIKVGIIRDKEGYKDQKDWTDKEGNVYIGRISPAFCIINEQKKRWPLQSPLFNPFKLEKVKQKKMIIC